MIEPPGLPCPVAALAVVGATTDAAEVVEPGAAAAGALVAVVPVTLLAGLVATAAAPPAAVAGAAVPLGLGVSVAVLPPQAARIAAAALALAPPRKARREYPRRIVGSCGCWFMLIPPSHYFAHGETTQASPIRVFVSRDLYHLAGYAVN